VYVYVYVVKCLWQC